MFRRSLIFSGCALVVAITAAGSYAATSSDESYVPSTASAAQITAAKPLQTKLSGFAKDFPPMCTGLVTPKREDTTAIENNDRVDISVPALEVTGLEAGTSYSHCFFVHNRSPEPIGFKVSALDLVGSLDPNQKQSIIRPPLALGSWFRPALTSFELASGERIYIPYTINVPTSKPTGSLAGGIEVQRDNSQLKNPTATGAGFAITMLHKVLVNDPNGTFAKPSVRVIDAPRLITRSTGESAYNVSFNTRNTGTNVDTFTPTLTMKGLGLKVASESGAPSTLLPLSAERSRLRIDELPWIGVYHPTLKVAGQGETTTIQLPWVFVLPPWPYVVALIAAILLPLIVWRRRRSRQGPASWDEDGEHDDGEYEHLSD